LAQNLTDAELVESTLAGEMSAYEELYRRHFSRAYDFAVRTTRDRERAADAVQDAFIKAHERLGQLRNHEAFRPWLFSIVRRETIAAVRSVARERPTEPFESDETPLNPLLRRIDEDPHDDPVAVAELADSAELVWEAAASLDPDTYTILDLHVRQGLSSAEIADVLGISKGSAYTRLNRMKERIASAISTYLLIRKGSADCDDLAALVRGVPLPPVRPDLRKKVDRHVSGCEACASRRRALVAPLKVFAALGLVPAPEGLQTAIWERIDEARRGMIPARRGGAARYAVVVGTIALVGLASGVAVGYAATHSGDASGTTSPIAIAGETTSTSTSLAVTSTTGVDRVVTSTTSSDGTSESTVTTIAPVTTTTPSPTTTLGEEATTAPPDTDPRVIESVSAAESEIWEEDSQSLSCPPGTPRSTEVSAMVADSGAGVGTVEAEWAIGSATGSATMSPSGSVYSFVFGPYDYPTVPDNASPQIAIVVRATDTAGNETKDSVSVTLHSLATCFG
jgi:RNA polymerase sigma factor (sigma-70 family)